MNFLIFEIEKRKKEDLNLKASRYECGELMLRELASIRRRIKELKQPQSGVCAVRRGRRFVVEKHVFAALHTWLRLLTPKEYETSRRTEMGPSRSYHLPKVVQSTIPSRNCSIHFLGFSGWGQLKREEAEEEHRGRLKEREDIAIQIPKLCLCPLNITIGWRMTSSTETREKWWS